PIGCAFIAAHIADAEAICQPRGTCGFSLLQSAALSDDAARLEATPMQVALAWLLLRSPNILLMPLLASLLLSLTIASVTITLPRRPSFTCSNKFFTLAVKSRASSSWK